MGGGDRAPLRGPGWRRRRSTTSPKSSYPTASSPNRETGSSNSRTSTWPAASTCRSSSTLPGYRWDRPHRTSPPSGGRPVGASFTADSVPGPIASKLSAAARADKEDGLFWGTWTVRGDTVTAQQPSGRVQAYHPRSPDGAERRTAPREGLVRDHRLHARAALRGWTGGASALHGRHEEGPGPGCIGRLHRAISVLPTVIHGLQGAHGRSTQRQAC